MNWERPTSFGLKGDSSSLRSSFCQSMERKNWWSRMAPWGLLGIPSRVAGFRSNSWLTQTQFNRRLRIVLCPRRALQFVRPRDWQVLRGCLSFTVKRKTFISEPSTSSVWFRCLNLRQEEHQIFKCRSGLLFVASFVLSRFTLHLAVICNHSVVQ